MKAESNEDSAFLKVLLKSKPINVVKTSKTNKNGNKNENTVSPNR